MDKSKIIYSITAHIPRSVCNLRCNYCYVTQAIDEKHTQRELYEYPLETMINAFSPDRLGGIAEFTVMSCGETLLDEIIVPFVHGLLRQGHVVTVVTNLTINDKVDELLNLDKENLKRLIVKGSLHWLELKRLNKIDDFFNNMNKVIDAGGSAFPGLVVCDEYMPYLEEIKETCLQKLCALPVVTPCLITQEMKEGGKYSSSPKCTPKFIKQMNDMFKSKLFNLSARVLKFDINKMFCYAGEWGFEVNIANGAIHKCHNCPVEGNFFEDITTMPNLEAIGINCQLPTCAFQHNFLGEGFIPEIKGIETLSALYNQKRLFNSTIKKLFDFKYTDFKKQYSKKEKDIISNNVCEQFSKKHKN